MSSGPVAQSFNGFLYVPDDPNKHLRGREIFVQALRRVPGFWESLRDGVLFPCSDHLLTIARNEEPTEESVRQAQRCFDEWLLARGIVDEWLMEAAQYSLQAWAMILLHKGRTILEKQCPRPWYGATEAALKPALEEFRAEFDQPYPVPLKPLNPEERRLLEGNAVGLRMYQVGVAREPLREFGRRMRKQFEEQLDRFIAGLEASMAESRNMMRNAEWTALYQCGMSPKAIEAWEANRSKTDHSYARIQQVIHQFAATIGLTLRPPKGGRKVRDTKTPRA